MMNQTNNLFTITKESLQHFTTAQLEMYFNFLCTFNSVTAYDYSEIYEHELFAAQEDHRLFYDWLSAKEAVLIELNKRPHDDDLPF